MLLYHGQVREDGRLTDFHILTEPDAGKRAGSKKQTAEQKCHPLILAQIIRVVDLLKACAETLPSILRDGQEDIRQKGEDVFFVLTNLNFEAVGNLCADPDYKARVVFQANAKEPTLKLRLAPGSDSLKQSKVFVKRYQGFCQ